MAYDTYHTNFSNLDLPFDGPALIPRTAAGSFYSVFTLFPGALHLARTVWKRSGFRIIFGLPGSSAHFSAPVYPTRRGHLSPDQSMKLTECGIGETARVIAVMGCEGFRNRLALRGIAPGQTCTVVSAACGPIVLAVDGGTVALGRGMAAHITVERNY